MRKYGKWQKGEYWKMDSKHLEKAFDKASKDVIKPTAVEQKGKRWRIYHKPHYAGEFWD